MGPSCGSQNLAPSSPSYTLHTDATFLHAPYTLCSLRRLTALARAAISQGQEVAPSAGMLPTARGDLEQLTRMSVELFGAAFGVPSDLLFSGRFASKSTAQ